MNGILTGLSKRVWWQQVLFVMLVTTMYVQMAGLIGTRVLVPKIGWSDSTGTDPAGASADSIEGRFARWDSGYYLQIAQGGYRPNGPERAFFPLYPLFIRLLSHTLNLPFLWSGWVISIACFLGAGLMLYKWVQIDYDSHIACWSVLWLCVFPMSFFFSSLYAEALFLITSLAAAYFARRGRFIASGFAIALAGATRPPAFLLAIPFILEFWKQHDFRWSRWLKFSLGALIAPLGMLGYLLFLGWQTGNLDLLSVYTSSEFRRAIDWPCITLYDGIRAAIWGVNIHADWFSRAIAWQDLTYALMALIIASWALLRLRLSMAIFLFASVLFLFANHGPYGNAFYSIPRYIAAVFPIYPAMALLTTKLPSRYWWIPLTVSLVVLGLLSAWFATGRWVA